jgi:hypothetical protein
MTRKRNHEWPLSGPLSLPEAEFATDKTLPGVDKKPRELIHSLHRIIRPQVPDGRQVMRQVRSLTIPAELMTQWNDFAGVRHYSVPLTDNPGERVPIDILLSKRGDGGVKGRLGIYAVLPKDYGGSRCDCCRTLII